MGRANVWAPINYMAVQGLKKYGFTASAKQIAQGFVSSAVNTFEKRGMLVERFNGPAQDVPHVNGQQYEPQDGFGWTNGVTASFMINELGYPLEKIAPNAAQSAGAHLPEAVQ